MEALSKNQTQPSLSGTISKIVDDTQTLVRQEIELAKAEVRQSAKAITGLLIGAAAAAFGFVLFTVAIAALLVDSGVPVGFACLGLAIVYFGAAIGCYVWYEKQIKEVGWPLGEPASAKKLASAVEGVQQENVRWLNNQT